jgi:hypothetical protein
VTSPVVFVDGQEAGRLLDVGEHSYSYAFPKAWDLSAQSILFPPGPEELLQADLESTVTYRIARYHGTWGRFPIRVGWSEGAQPTQEAMQRHVTADVLRTFASVEHERIRAERTKPAEVLEPGRGLCLLCNPALVLDPTEPGRYWGECRGCGWKTSKTFDYSQLDGLIRGHLDAAVDELRTAAREWKAAHPDLDAEKNAAEIVAALDALHFLTDGFGW